MARCGAPLFALEAGTCEARLVRPCSTRFVPSSTSFVPPAQAVRISLVLLCRPYGFLVFIHQGPYVARGFSFQVRGRSGLGSEVQGRRWCIKTSSPLYERKYQLVLSLQRPPRVRARAHDLSQTSGLALYCARTHGVQDVRTQP